SLLGDDYDAEIIELHHNQKVDAPSGTALALGRAVAEARGVDFEQVALRDRDGITGVRPTGAIGLQALRGGDVAGEHSVLLIGGGERLELSHRAATREHFARGALRAAIWSLGQSPGLYDMEDVLGMRA
ncbi:MAG: 4-hydroxy-tetrahydrodipicolinate reductase, partial [Myxococcales bacterium]|nr:4-hydroxy-tetrahydrodipicolinate reductase [Myxococcales bacterium]